MCIPFIGNGLHLNSWLQALKICESKGGASVAGFRSATIPQDRLLPGIHGLRGIATLSVALYHLVHIVGLATPDAFGFIGRDFGKGVHLFFVLSGFSLMHSTEDSMNRPGWVTEYFLKRFFRIAPLFYTVLAGMVLWPFVQWHMWSVDFNTLLLNVTFMFGFAPWSGIVWAGWTVGVEMLFYAILPVLLLAVRTRLASLVLVVVTIAISLSSYSILDVHFEQSAAKYHCNWAYFSFLPNLCFFAFGILAYRIAQAIQPMSATLRWILPAVSAVMFSTLILAGHRPTFTGMGRGNVVLWGIGFAVLCVWQGKRASRWSANRIFEYVGERGFSVYLLHPVLFYLLKDRLQSAYASLSAGMGASAYFVCAVLALIPLMMLSEITYRWIEIPGIRTGREIIRRMRAAAGTPSTA